MNIIKFVFLFGLKTRSAQDGRQYENGGYRPNNYYTENYCGQVNKKLALPSFFS